MDPVWKVSGKIKRGTAGINLFRALAGGDMVKLMNYRRLKAGS
jgi:hypothetical protein